MQGHRELERDDKVRGREHGKVQERERGKEPGGEWLGSFVRSGVGMDSLVWANFAFIFDISVVLFVPINIIIYDLGMTIR